MLVLVWKLGALYVFPSAVADALFYMFTFGKHLQVQLVTVIELRVVMMMLSPVDMSLPVHN